METKTSVSAPMTKDLLMKYTLVALLIISVTSVVAFGTPALIMILTAVIVALLCDYLVSPIFGEKAPLDVYSSAVAGMIVALSFSHGIPFPVETYYPTFTPPTTYLVVAIISAVTIIGFKKIQGLLGRKYVNPAATAKLLILAPLYSTALIPEDHTIFDISSFEVLEGALQMCFSATAPFKDPLLVLTVLKNHGWLGGASSIAVIVVGIALIVASRGYIKWKIPLTYLVTTAVICAGYSFMNGEDVIVRMAYHLFIGSSIFLAFFMATDPATTPLTGTGQVIFGVGLSVLSMIFQLQFLFLGGSILALIIMNLMTPVLDKVGVPEPQEERVTRKLPKAKKFETVTVRSCLRCGRCIDSCPVYLSPILIKEAVDKGDWTEAKNLEVEFCVECGQCSYVCPVRIPLKDEIVSAKERLKEMGD